MSSPAEAINRATNQPIRTIQTIIAITLAILAIYVALPWFIPSTGSAAAAAFADNWIQQSVVGTLMLLPTLPILAGLFWERYNTIEWYVRSTLWIFVCWLFLMLLRLFTIGVFPLVWVPSLGLALIVGVCHLYWKAK